MKKGSRKREGLGKGSRGMSLEQGLQDETALNHEEKEG